jgi:hypothetical protein
MTPEQYRQLFREDESLEVGTPVIVRWGYGLNFRVEGKGKIAKVNRKSVQVELTEDVPSPHDADGVGWPAGFVLKGIPRVGNLHQWNYWNSVELEAK